MSEPSRDGFYVSRHEASFADCRGPYPTREAACEAAPMALGLGPQGVFWSAKGAPETRTFPPMARVAVVCARDDALDDDDIEDPFAKGWLEHVSAKQIDQLDGMLREAWNNWLRKNDLMPSWLTFDAIQRHKVPGRKRSRRSSQAEEGA